VEIEKSDLMEIHPNLVTFNDWQILKQTGLTKGFANFSPEELDNIAVFYTDNLEFLDYLERKEIENITPAYVLVPRFFWEMHDYPGLEEASGIDRDERLKIFNTHRRETRFRLETRMMQEIQLFKFNATPRPEQQPVLDTFIEIFNRKHSLRGILQAAPGFGKTITAIKAVHGFRAQSIIIVPNEVLQDQWKEAILEFTDLTEDQIGIIQGSDLNKIELKSINIVKIQSLYSQIKRNKIWELLKIYNYIDFVIYDECHNSGAATGYAKTSSLFLTPNIIGLSATPYRDGINKYMLESAIGEVIAKPEHNNLSPDVEVHNVYVPFSQGETNRLKTIGQDYVMFLGMFNAMMKSKQTYFEYLADVVAWNYQNKYNIVILFSTIALMEKLQEQLYLRHPDLKEKILLLKGKTKEDAMTLVKAERKVIMEEYKLFKERKDQDVKDKKIKRKEYQEIVKKRRKEIDEHIDYLKEHALDLYKQKVKSSEIIISNYNLLSAGFDKPQLSNIIFGAAPRVGKISVIQSIGRITRKYSDKNKPLVQYFVPSAFFEFKKSTGVILSNNIKIQYPDAKIRYIGFKRE